MEGEHYLHASSPAGRRKFNQWREERWSRNLTVTMLFLWFSPLLTCARIKALENKKHLLLKHTHTQISKIIKYEWTVTSFMGSLGNRRKSLSIYLSIYWTHPKMELFQKPHQSFNFHCMKKEPRTLSHFSFQDAFFHKLAFCGVGINSPDKQSAHTFQWCEKMTIQYGQQITKDLAYVNRV